MGRKAPEGLGLAGGSEANSLDETQNHGHSAVARAGGTGDSSTLETTAEQQVNVPVVHPGGTPQSESGGRRYSVAFSALLILVLTMCASVSVGSMAWGRSRRISAGVAPPAQAPQDKEQPTTFAVDSLTQEESEEEDLGELREDLLEALVEFRRRPEGLEPPLNDIVSGVVPRKDDAVAASLARALDAVHSASAHTQRQLADKYLDQLFWDCGHRDFGLLLQGMVQEVQAAAPSEEDTNPEKEEAQSARTALLVAVLDAFTARVKAIERLKLVKEDAADEEARLEDQIPRERVGLAQLLRKVQGVPEGAAEAAAQQVESVSASVPAFKAQRLLNIIQHSREKLAGDLNVAVALFGALQAGDYFTPGTELESLESVGVASVQGETTLSDRDKQMGHLQEHQHKLLRDMMKSMEADGQGKDSLRKASELLFRLYRMDMACRFGASQREDFWQFLKNHWSPKAHDTLCELIGKQDKIFQESEYVSRTYTLMTATSLRGSASKEKQVDLLLLQAALALL
ncbi:uncharacterized protein EMH_0072510 [Eimeria mitis]|uniref:Transmembrane protein n=1 Tax=Eimeria mitis TaxID=44415 RepID=U6K356_9EIME|nr:uncharacterized protein EMH_0072510 [Eimeria mitis]CDJ32114.1 hypothetical protein EMH_0072510 [Eimeria mitis]